MEPESPDRQQVKVTILNQTFTLRTNGDPRETIELARKVDELMTGIASRSQNLDTTRVAVLACLHLADQLRETEAQLTELQQRVASKARKFSGLLEEALEARL
jgi:cell division protein ZapA